MLLLGSTSAVDGEGPCPGSRTIVGCPEVLDELVVVDGDVVDVVVVAGVELAGQLQPELADEVAVLEDEGVLVVVDVALVPVANATS
jgi:hypothetical protein